MKQFFKDLVTESDGVSFDIVPVLGAIALVAALFFTGWVVIHKGSDFSMAEFSGGVAALLLAIGGGQKLKPPALKDET